MRRGLVNWILIFLGFESKGSVRIGFLKEYNVCRRGTAVQLAPSSCILVPVCNTSFLFSIGAGMLRTSKEVSKNIFFKQ